MDFYNAVVGHQTGRVAVRMDGRSDAIAELVIHELLSKDGKFE